MAKKFASQADMDEKEISFTEIGKDLWAFLRKVTQIPELLSAMIA